MNSEIKNKIEELNKKEELEFLKSLNFGGGEITQMRNSNKVLRRIEELVKEKEEKELKKPMTKIAENSLNKIIDKIISENHSPKEKAEMANSIAQTSKPNVETSPEDTSNQICECGHKRPETIIIDDNILSVTAYFEYKEQLPKECWDCFCKKFKKKEVKMPLINQEVVYDGIK